MFLLFALFCVVSCKLLPGKLTKLPDNLRIVQKSDSIILATNSSQTLSVQYLGCGGLYLLKDSTGILIDPFFSSQKIPALVRSTLGNKRKIASDPKMVQFGLNALYNQDPRFTQHIKSIFVAHSHYDHLLDVPAVWKALKEKPEVYLNESGSNVCNGVIESGKMTLLEDYETTYNCIGRPVMVGKKVRVYPILAAHNPHTNHIKFFDGSLTSPLVYFNDPFDKTKANDWLEGKTFSFLIDYLDDQDQIQLRLFVQSSSCNPTAGIPPADLLKERPVDIAFLCVASYESSPFYPEVVITKTQPKKIVWIHWEDFFRDYDKSPRTVRATDVPGFFEKEMVRNNLGKSCMPWPRTILEIRY